MEHKIIAKIFGWMFTTVFLERKVNEDLALRAESKRKDRWYWADIELLRRGYYGNNSG